MTRELGWSKLSTRGPWGGAALTTPGQTDLHVMRRSASPNYIISWECEVWWEISYFGFTRLAGTVGSVGHWIRATAGEMGSAE